MISPLAERLSDEDLDRALTAHALVEPQNAAEVPPDAVQSASFRQLVVAAHETAADAESQSWPLPVLERCSWFSTADYLELVRSTEAARLVPIDVLVAEAHRRESSRSAHLAVARAGEAFRLRDHEAARRALDDARAALDRAGQPRFARPDLSALCVRLPGKYRRIPTHFAPLDARTGGGLTTGRLVLVGGAPGVTKTGWTLAMARAMARAGTLVHFLAADEPRDGLLSRLGQMEGVSRADLEDEDPAIAGAAWAYAGERLREIPQLVIWDAHDDGVTVEQVAAHAKREAAQVGARLVVIVDSVQAAPFGVDALLGEKSPRERMDGRVEVLRAMRDRTTCVVAISELNRAAYGGMSTGPNLASFKESSSLEYRADLPLTLHRVKDEDDVIEVTPQKNRLGSGAAGLEPFRMRRTERCTFEAVDMPDAAAAAERAETAADARVDDAKERLVQALARATAEGRKVTNAGELRRLIKGRESTTVKAIADLKIEARIERTAAGWRVVPGAVTAGARGDEWGSS